MKLNEYEITKRKTRRKKNTHTTYACITNEQERRKKNALKIMDMDSNMNK